MTNPEEAQLIRRCLEKDRSAWQTLVERHHRPLYSIAHRILLNPEDAEDAVQDAWVRITRSLPRFDGRASFRTWATRIVLHRSLTKARSMHPTMPVDDLLENLAAPASGDWNPSPDRLDLDRALSDLSPDERAAVILHYGEGYTFKEIAELLEIPQRTAANRAYRGFRRLQKAMRGVSVENDR
ncbi:MAG: RNA polymerase sigma factor [Armatimonadetes bacterium]|nr:RNA polymerase sigma factor [Armatimonadota bacterium]